MTRRDSEILFTAGEAAAVLERSSDTARQLERAGILRAAYKTKGGIRLFRPEDVQKLAEERKRKAETAK